MGEPGGHARWIVLVGLPGAGKTEVGRRLAARLGRRFLDFDEAIAVRTGQTIPEIFASRGEEHFRQLEASLTAEVAREEGLVLSPGGGWVAQPGLVELLGGGAKMIHLRVSIETALARMGGEVDRRPLLSDGDAAARLTDLWRARRAAYERADVEIDTEVLDAEGVAVRLAELIEQSGW